LQNKKRELQLNYVYTAELQLLFPVRSLEFSRG